MNEIRLYKSKLQGLKLILISSVFVVAGSFMIHGTDFADAMAGWLMICIFGIGVPFGIYVIFDPRPVVIFNEKGISYKRYGEEMIPWEKVRSVSVNKINAIRFVSIAVSQEFDANNPEVSLKDINVSFPALDKKAGAIRDLIERLMKVGIETRYDIIKREHKNNSGWMR